MGSGVEVVLETSRIMEGLWPVVLEWFNEGECRREPWGTWNGGRMEVASAEDFRLSVS